MTPCNGADRFALVQRLGDDLCLILGAPSPSSTGASEHLDPPNRLRDSTMFSVHSKPSDPNRIVDSHIKQHPERCDQNSAYDDLAPGSGATVTGLNTAGICVRSHSC